MPNLLPDWTQTLPWDLGEINLRAAGRLIWSTLFLIIGIAFVIALIKPPMLKRPFSLKVGVALFPIIIVVGLLLGRFIPSFQRSIIWLTFAAVLAHSFLMVLSRKPRDPPGRRPGPRRSRARPSRSRCSHWPTRSCRTNG